MGCGPSSPAKTVEGPATATSAATKPPLAPKKPNAEQTMLDPSTLPEVQKDSANTVSSTAETQASTGRYISKIPPFSLSLQFLTLQQDWTCYYYSEVRFEA